MRGLALTASSKLLAFYVYLVGWAKYHAAEQMEDIPTLKKGNLYNRKKHCNNIRYNMSVLSAFIVRLATSFKYIKSKKYCAV